METVEKITFIGPRGRDANLLHVAGRFATINRRSGVPVPHHLFFRLPVTPTKHHDTDARVEFYPPSYGNSLLAGLPHISGAPCDPPREAQKIGKSAA